MTGCKHRIEPLQRRNARTLAARTASRTRSMRSASERSSSTPRSRDSVAVRDRADVPEHLAERVRVECDHVGRARAASAQARRPPRRRRRRPGRAPGSRSGRVPARRAERCRASRSTRLPGSLAHGTVDLARRKPGRQRVTCDARQLASRRRVVALVCDRDHLGSEAEGEDQFRRVRDEADNAHECHC